MLRRRFTFASALSLLLCLGTCVMWVRSYRHMDGFSFWTSQGLQELMMRRGRLVLDNEPQRELDRQLLARVHRREDVLFKTCRDMDHKLAVAAGAYDRNPDPSHAEQMMRRYYAQQNAESDWGKIFELRLKMEKDPAVLSLATSHSVPAYLILTPAALPTTWLVSKLLVLRRARHRLRNGQCRACGYDLRASPDRCPECGTAATPKKQLSN